MMLDARIADLRRVVAEARSMPMSSSAVVNRPELLSMIDELLAAARDEQQRLTSDTEVARRAKDRAEAVLTAAHREVEAPRKQADDYVDTRLAGLEVALERSLDTVRRGRERLAEGSGLDLSGDASDVRLPDHLEG